MCVFKYFFYVGLLIVIVGCNDNDTIDYTDPKKLAGNWVVFEFQGGTLDGELADPYDMVTALSPNEDNTLILDNLYNTKTRIKAHIQGDTGFFAIMTDQLEVINEGDYGIKKISIEGYINNNYVLKNFTYRLAASSFENIAFTEEDIEEIIFFRAGYYDEYNSLVDTVMVMGYRKTGFEDENYD